MAELLLFHHAQGLTAGCLSFADELRAAGHVVHAPDLYYGETFADSPTALATPSTSASTRSSSAVDSPLTA
jgi:dienelactone hydrolase